MSSIQFFCPNCSELIAFDSKHIGKQAHCTNCGQAFLIPLKDYGTPKKIEETIEKGSPIPGFYRAVFLGNWKLFVARENATTLVFVLAVVCFQYFLSSTCCNIISPVIIWGWLLGFYLNIIYETAFDCDELPKIYLGTSITFLWYIIRPFFVFFFTGFFVLLPFIIVLSIYMNKGIIVPGTLTNIGELPLLLKILFFIGLFFFPMAILITAVGQDCTMLRPDYILGPIFKTFIPYLITVLLLTAACLPGTLIKPFDSSDLALTAKQLGLNIAIQVVAIFSMRSIGLLYRHYKCNLPW